MCDDIERPYVWLVTFTEYIGFPAVFTSENAAKARIQDLEDSPLQWEAIGDNEQRATGKQEWVLVKRIIQGE